MEHKVLEPIELTDAELDIVSGGSFVGIKQSNRGGNVITKSGGSGGALAFILWVLALERASPTRVANTMTVNPIAAGLLATQLVGEPITLNLVVGLIAVFIGIWIATTEGRKA